MPMHEEIAKYGVVDAFDRVINRLIAKGDIVCVYDADGELSYQITEKGGRRLKNK
jgi:hypothetical protein